MNRKAHWERVYAAKAPEQLSWYQPRPEVSLSLIERAGLDSEARIIDVGGGASTLVDALLDRGYKNLTVLDVAEESARRAQARLEERAERVTWVLTDVVEFKPSHPFDLWHDRAVFHFLTDAADRVGYRRALYQSLAPGGQAIIATFGPTGPEKCSGLDVVRYSPEALGEELGPSLQLEESCEELHTTPGGVSQAFVYCRFHRSH